MMRSTSFSKDANGVGVIDHDPGFVLLGEFDNRRKIRNIALHTEDTVDNDQFAFPLSSLENPLQIVHIVMAELLDLAKRHTASIDDAGVVILIDNGCVSPTQKRRNGPEIGLITSGKDYGRVLPEKFRQLSLQVFVNFEVSVEEP
jgi:hypothetical protein